MKTETPLNNLSSLKDNVADNVKNLAQEIPSILELNNSFESGNVGYGYNFNKWQPWRKVCPKCGSTDTEYDSSMCLTSLPPKYHCRCKSCQNTWYGSIEYTPVVPPSIPDFPNEKTGWICPICGRGVNPDLSVCPYCKPNNSNITYSTKLSCKVD